MYFNIWINASFPTAASLRSQVRIHARAASIQMIYNQ
jgi:hypothetical protein